MIKVYTKDKCVQCVAVKRWLDNEGVDYELLDALEHMEYLETTGIRQMPIVVSDNGSAFGGFDVAKLQQITGGS